MNKYDLPIFTTSRAIYSHKENKLIFVNEDLAFEQCKLGPFMFNSSFIYYKDKNRYTFFDFGNIEELHISDYEIILKKESAIFYILDDNVLYIMKDNTIMRVNKKATKFVRSLIDINKFYGFDINNNFLSLPLLNKVLEKHLTIYKTKDSIVLGFFMFKAITTILEGG